MIELIVFTLLDSVLIRFECSFHVEEDAAVGSWWPRGRISHVEGLATWKDDTASCGGGESETGHAWCKFNQSIQQ